MTPLPREEITPRFSEDDQEGDDCGPNIHDTAKISPQMSGAASVTFPRAFQKMSELQSIAAAANNEDGTLDSSFFSSCIVVINLPFICEIPLNL